MMDVEIGQMNSKVDGTIVDTTKFYELLDGTTLVGMSTAGQGLEMMMQTLENEEKQEIEDVAVSVSSRTLAVTIPSTTIHSVHAGITGGALTTSTSLQIHPSVVLHDGTIGVDREVGDDRPHMCDVCHATYKTRTHLRRHMYVHLSSRAFPCPDCGKGFNRKEHLTKHIEAVHSGTKYKCEYCSKEISRKDHLSRHIKNMHLNSAEYRKNEKSTVEKIPTSQNKNCYPLAFLPNFTISPGISFSDALTTCSSSNATGITLKSARYKPNSQPTSSNAQFMMLPVPATMFVSHISNPKPGSTRSAQSGPNSSVNVYNITADVNTSNVSISSTNDPQTDLLAASVTTKTDKKSMILQIFNCTECTATFTSEKELNVHRRIHKPQPYECSDCSRAYTRREKLMEHIRCVHQGQKFTCEYCGKELSRKDHVLRHVRSVHPEVLTNRFVAQITERGSHGTATAESRSANVLQTSNGESVPSMGEMGVLLRSVCHICLKVFGTTYHLSRHIESCHNGDLRPYSCSACTKQFKRKDHLTKHMKSHCPSTRESYNSFSKASIKSENSSTYQPDIAMDGNSQITTLASEAMDSLQMEIIDPINEKLIKDENLTTDENDDESDEDDENEGGEDILNLPAICINIPVPSSKQGSSDYMNKVNMSKTITEGDKELNAVLESFIADSDSSISITPPTSTECIKRNARAGLLPQHSGNSSGSQFKKTLMNGVKLHEHMQPYPSNNSNRGEFKAQRLQYY